MMIKNITNLILVSLFLSGLIGNAEVVAGGPKVPSFELVSLDGKRITQEDMIGKVTLVIFWASWCGTCQHELPKVHRLQEKMAGSPFQVIAIGFRDSEANIRGYARSHPNIFSFPVFFDKKDRVAAVFGASVTPTLFLFDKQGELAVRYRGGGMFSHPKFKETLEALL
ncbi:MAG: TlpA family protein disulfide reductase [Nitrospiria bacterium]